MSVVVKFGGTSVGSAEAIAQAADIVARLRARTPVVVVSATAGTTNAVIEAARRAEQGDAAGAQEGLDRIARRHYDLIDEMFGSGSPLATEINDLSDRTAALLRSVAILRELTRRSLDAIMSYGERLAAPIFAAALARAGVRAEPISAEGLIVTDDAFGRAAPLPDETRARVERELLPRVADGVVPVVTGFIGATREGVTTTLGRGGSDYSASVLAAAIGAEEVLIYTDVSGVMSADPRGVPDARPLARLSYAEAAELSFFGAKVIHPRTVLPAVEAGIPVRILNTFDPGFAGTVVTSEAQGDGSIVKAVTSIGGLGLITVEGAGMSGVPGMAARVFDTVAADGVSVLLISQSSSENNICFAVANEHCARLIADLRRAFAAELGRHDVGRVYAESPVAIVAAVGEGMKGTPGVAGRLFTALGRRGINVVAIAQGSSELNISLVVADAQREAAVRAIHDEFHVGAASDDAARALVGRNATR